MMFGQWLQANLLLETGVTEVAIVGDLGSPAAGSLLGVVRSDLSTRPGGGRPRGGRPIARPDAAATGSPAPGETAEAWVCRGFTCATSPPATRRSCPGCWRPPLS